jgi:hypothetical protein
MPVRERVRLIASLSQGGRLSRGDLLVAGALFGLLSKVLSSGDDVRESVAPVPTDPSVALADGPNLFQLGRESRSVIDLMTRFSAGQTLPSADELLATMREDLPAALTNLGAHDQVAAATLLSGFPSFTAEAGTATPLSMGFDDPKDSTDGSSLTLSSLGRDLLDHLLEDIGELSGFTVDFPQEDDFIELLAEDSHDLHLSSESSDLASLDFVDDGGDFVETSDVQALDMATVSPEESNFIPVAAIGTGAMIGGVGGVAAAGIAGGISAVGGSSIGGSVIDGHVVGATVFYDQNRNGILDEGEVWTVTDKLGSFTFNTTAALEGGNIVVLPGGYDSNTGQQVGRFVMPGDATVATPLTMIFALTDIDKADLAIALGLSGVPDLGGYDPVVEMKSTAADANPDLAEQVFSIQQRIFTTLQAGAIVAGGGKSTQESLAVAARTVGEAINELLALGEAVTVADISDLAISKLVASSGFDADFATALQFMVNETNERIETSYTGIAQALRDQQTADEADETPTEETIAILAGGKAAASLSQDTLLEAVSEGVAGGSLTSTADNFEASLDTALVVKTEVFETLLAMQAGLEVTSEYGNATYLVSKLIEDGAAAAQRALDEAVEAQLAVDAADPTEPTAIERAAAIDLVQADGPIGVDLLDLASNFADGVTLSQLLALGIQHIRVLGSNTSVEMELGRGLSSVSSYFDSDLFNGHIKTNSGADDGLFAQGYSVTLKVTNAQLAELVTYSSQLASAGIDIIKPVSGSLNIGLSDAQTLIANGISFTSGYARLTIDAADQVLLSDGDDTTLPFDFDLVYDLFQAGLKFPDAGIKATINGVTDFVRVEIPEGDPRATYAIIQDMASRGAKFAGGTVEIALSDLVGAVAPLQASLLDLANSGVGFSFNDNVVSGWKLGLSTSLTELDRPELTLSDALALINAGITLNNARLLIDSAELDLVVQNATSIFDGGVSTLVLPAGQPVTLTQAALLIDAAGDVGLTGEAIFSGGFLKDDGSISSLSDVTVELTAGLAIDPDYEPSLSDVWELVDDLGTSFPAGITVSRDPEVSSSFDSTSWLRLIEAGVRFGEGYFALFTNDDDAVELKASDYLTMLDAGLVFDIPGQSIKSATDTGYVPFATWARLSDAWPSDGGDPSPFGDVALVITSASQLAEVVSVAKTAAGSQALNGKEIAFPNAFSLTFADADALLSAGMSIERVQATFEAYTEGGAAPISLQVTAADQLQSVIAGSWWSKGIDSVNALGVRLASDALNSFLVSDDVPENFLQNVTIRVGSKEEFVALVSDAGALADLLGGNTRIEIANGFATSDTSDGGKGVSLEGAIAILDAFGDAGISFQGGFVTDTVGSASPFADLARLQKFGLQASPELKFTIDEYLDFFFGSARTNLVTLSSEVGNEGVLKPEFVGFRLNLDLDTGRAPSFDEAVALAKLGVRFASGTPITIDTPIDENPSGEVRELISLIDAGFKVSVATGLKAFDLNSGDISNVSDPATKLVLTQPEVAKLLALRDTDGSPVTIVDGDAVTVDTAAQLSTVVANLSAYKGFNEIRLGSSVIPTFTQVKALILDSGDGNLAIKNDAGGKASFSVTLTSAGQLNGSGGGLTATKLSENGVTSVQANGLAIPVEYLIGSETALFAGITLLDDTDAWARGFLGGAQILVADKLVDGKSTNGSDALDLLSEHVETLKILGFTQIVIGNQLNSTGQPTVNPILLSTADVQPILGLGGMTFSGGVINDFGNVSGQDLLRFINDASAAGLRIDPTAERRVTFSDLESTAPGGKIDDLITFLKRGFIFKSEENDPDPLFNDVSLGVSDALRLSTPAANGVTVADSTLEVATLNDFNLLIANLSRLEAGFVTVQMPRSIPLRLDQALALSSRFSEVKIGDGTAPIVIQADSYSQFTQTFFDASGDLLPGAQGLLDARGNNTSDIVFAFPGSAVTYAQAAQLASWIREAWPAKGSGPPDPPFSLTGVSISVPVSGRITKTNGSAVTYDELSAISVVTGIQLPTSGFSNSAYIAIQGTSISARALLTFALDQDVEEIFLNAGKESSVRLSQLQWESLLPHIEKITNLTEASVTVTGVVASNVSSLLTSDYVDFVSVPANQSLFLTSEQFKSARLVRDANLERCDVTVVDVASTDVSSLLDSQYVDSLRVATDQTLSLLVDQFNSRKLIKDAGFEGSVVKVSGATASSITSLLDSRYVDSVSVASNQLLILTLDQFKSVKLEKDASFESSVVTVTDVGEADDTSAGSILMLANDVHVDNVVLAGDRLSLTQMQWDALLSNLSKIQNLSSMNVSVTNVTVSDEASLSELLSLAADERIDRIVLESVDIGSTNASLPFTGWAKISNPGVLGAAKITVNDVNLHDIEAVGLLNLVSNPNVSSIYFTPDHSINVSLSEWEELDQNVEKLQNLEDVIVSISGVVVSDTDASTAFLALTRRADIDFIVLDGNQTLTLNQGEWSQLLQNLSKVQRSANSSPISLRLNGVTAIPDLNQLGHFSLVGITLAVGLTIKFDEWRSIQNIEISKDGHPLHVADVDLNLRSAWDTLLDTQVDKVFITEDTLLIDEPGEWSQFRELLKKISNSDILNAKVLLGPNQEHLLTDLEARLILDGNLKAEVGIDATLVVENASADNVFDFVADSRFTRVELDPQQSILLSQSDWFSLLASPKFFHTSIETSTTLLKGIITYVDVNLGYIVSSEPVVSSIGFPEYSNIIDGRALGDGVDGIFVAQFNQDARGGAIFAGKGDDLIIGGVGHDYLFGHEGDDTFVPLGHADVIVGGGGADIVEISADAHYEEIEREEMARLIAGVLRANSGDTMAPVEDVDRYIRDFENNALPRIGDSPDYDVSHRFIGVWTDYNKEDTLAWDDSALVGDGNIRMAFTAEFAQPEVAGNNPAQVTFTSIMLISDVSSWSLDDLVLESPPT